MSVHEATLPGPESPGVLSAAELVRELPARAEQRCVLGLKRNSGDLGFSFDCWGPTHPCLWPLVSPETTAPSFCLKLFKHYFKTAETFKKTMGSDSSWYDACSPSAPLCTALARFNLQSYRNDGSHVYNLSTRFI